MLEVIGSETLLRNTASDDRHGYEPQPGCHPLTKSEDRGNLVIKGN